MMLLVRKMMRLKMMSTLSPWLIDGDNDYDCGDGFADADLNSAQPHPLYQTGLIEGAREISLVAKNLGFSPSRQHNIITIVTTITSITTANINITTIITIITTILIIIISIKPVSSRTMLGSKNFFIFIITTITTNCWWPTQYDNNIHRHHKEKKLFTRIGIPASCGRSSRLCSSLRLAWMVIITIMMMTLVKLTVMVITKYNGDDNYGVGDTGTSILSWSAASTI